MEILTTEEIYERYETLESKALHFAFCITLTEILILSIINTTKNVYGMDFIINSNMEPTIRIINIAIIIAFIVASIMFFHARKAMRMICILAEDEFNEEKTDE